MTTKGLTDPGTVWPRGTLRLREPRLAHADGFMPRVKPAKVGVIKPMATQARPVRVRTIRLVPLASLLRVKNAF